MASGVGGPEIWWAVAEAGGGAVAQGAALSPRAVSRRGRGWVSKQQLQLSISGGGAGVKS